MEKIWAFLIGGILGIAVIYVYLGIGLFLELLFPILAPVLILIGFALLICYGVICGVGMACVPQDTQWGTFGATVVPTVLFVVQGNTMASWFIIISAGIIFLMIFLEPDLESETASP